MAVSNAYGREGWATEHGMETPLRNPKSPKSCPMRRASSCSIHCYSPRGAVQPIRPAVAVALGPLESLGLPCQGRYSALSPVKPAVHLAAIGPLGPGRRLTAENLWTTASLGLEKKRNLQHPKMSPGSAHQLPYSDDAVLDPGFLFPQLGAAQTYPNLG